jgi:uncharacterized protein with von Willebrand factor type A (vWA) domain
MQDDINEIIAKHLPAQVGEVLRTRLTMAEVADRKIVEQGTIMKGLREENAKLAAENSKAHDILKREQALVANEAQQREAQLGLDSQAAVLKARSDIINHLLERDERILGLVFGNNRFKYQENRDEQVAFPPPPATQYNSCPQAQTGHQRRSVQT